MRKSAFHTQLQRPPTADERAIGNTDMLHRSIKATKPPRLIAHRFNPMIAAPTLA
jgi:hypothetical protein